MKIRLLILFLFVGFAASAQLSEIYNLSTIEFRNGKFYQIKHVILSDSSETIRIEPMTDTSKVVEAFVASVIEQTRQYARDAVRAARKGIVIRTLQSAEDILRQYLDISIRDNIRDRMLYTDTAGVVRHTLEGTDYKFDSGTVTNAAIVRQANGSLRFRPNVAQQTTYGITVFGDYWIRVNAYPSAGQFLDFFFDTETGLFISDTRQANGTPFRLRKASLAVGVNSR